MKCYHMPFKMQEIKKDDYILIKNKSLVNMINIIIYKVVEQPMANVYQHNSYY